MTLSVISKIESHCESGDCDSLLDLSIYRNGVALFLGETGM